MRAIMGPKSKIIMNLAESMEIPYIPLELRVFPDGEVCPRVPEFGEFDRIYLFNQLSSSNFLPNRYLLEYYFMINLLKDLEVKHIDVIMPYLPYGRQDKIFRLGEPFSLKYVLELFVQSGVSRFYTLMAHISRLSDIVEPKENMRLVNLSPMDPITQYIRDLKLKKPFIIGPDKESLKWADQLADRLDTEYICFDKKRDINTGEVKTRGDLPNLNGKEVVVIDDIISTGKTIENAVKIIQKKNPKSINVVAMHGIFSGNSIEMLSKYNLDIITSNTIINPYAKISVQDILTRAIKKW